MASTYYEITGELLEKIKLTLTRAAATSRADASYASSEFSEKRFQFQAAELDGVAVEVKAVIDGEDLIETRRAV